MLSRGRGLLLLIPSLAYTPALSRAFTSFVVAGIPKSQARKQDDRNPICRRAQLHVSKSALLDMDLPSPPADVSWRTRITLLTQSEAQAIDDELMSTPGFSVDQLMELAGLSVAQAVDDYLVREGASFDRRSSILILCGPGNNGGDGLVAARHLYHFGYRPKVVYPKRPAKQLYQNLVAQIEDLGIEVAYVLPEDIDGRFDLVVDALFGFGSSGVPRPPFDQIIKRLGEIFAPVVSVDIPSGWDVERGDVHGLGFSPEVLVSLTAPKKCAVAFRGRHYLGGRFVPPRIRQKYKLRLPAYPGTLQFVEIPGWDDEATALEEPEEEAHVRKAPADEFIVVWVTAPSVDEARKLASGLVNEELAACVNLVPAVESIYRWEGKVEKGDISTSPDEDQKQLLIKLHQEFWNLPTNYQEKPMVFGSQSKNRYKTILPNEHSRVILQKEEGVHLEPYINANYIKGPDYTTDTYIATQGPMQNTVYEFWLMVLQNIQKKSSDGIQKIAMLTDFVESQRQKCAVYFPKDPGNCEIFTSTGFTRDENLIRDSLEIILNTSSNDETAKQLPKTTFNYFIIKNCGLKQKNGYSIRKLSLIYGNYSTDTIEQYKVFHYWFPDWPDHRSPQDIDVLLDMSLDLLDGDCRHDFEEESYGEDVTRNKNPLPIIHCSAGIGRTGCLAAILNGLGQIRTNGNPLTGDGTSVDILGIVCNLRLQRGGMVQNSEQYELIHRSLCLYQQKLRKK